MCTCKTRCRRLTGPQRIPDPNPRACGGNLTWKESVWERRHPDTRTDGGQWKDRQSLGEGSGSQGSSPTASRRSTTPQTP